MLLRTASLGSAGARAAPRRAWQPHPSAWLQAKPQASAESAAFIASMRVVGMSSNWIS